MLKRGLLILKDLPKVEATLINQLFGLAFLKMEVVAPHKPGWPETLLSSVKSAKRFIEWAALLLYFIALEHSKWS